MITTDPILLGKKWSRVLARRKTTTGEVTEDSKLARVLGLVDLTSLGVGATLGLGVYVLAGEVARETAGPAVTISFLIAAIASALAGICYAEFAARVPKAGSAYVYSYVTIGEFCAFVIGWNLILEYAIGTASVAKGLSSYIDSMLGNTMSRTLESTLPIHVPFLSKFPDFLASGLVLLLTILLSCGVRESSFVNNIFTVVNLFTVITVIVAGSFKANPSNWIISKEYAQAHKQNPQDKVGEGGFAPFGIAGIMAGAAKCFFGFVGFDIIATTGEEAKNPKKNIPIAIVISLFIIFLSYFGIATVLTMMLPYYEQDKETSIVTAFERVDLKVLTYLISVGAISALSASLLGAIFPLPRILYAMAEDGLLFSCMAQVSEKTKTPITATVLSGILAAFISGIFNLDQLINMMSIGTLLAYTIVTMCVVLLRYKADEESLKQSDGPVFDITEDSSPSPVGNPLMGKFKLLFNLVGSKRPSSGSQTISKFVLFTFCLSEALFCFVFEYINESTTRMYSLLVLLLSMIASFVILARQPQNDVSIIFKVITAVVRVLGVVDDNYSVPLVPLLPCISIIMNTYLMVKLDVDTWIRFVGWLIIGFLIYIFYSIDNSVQGKRDKLMSSQLSATKKEESEMKR